MNPASRRAAGTFEVKMTPQAPAEGSELGRFALDKRYHGGLEASSKGEMLSAGAPQKGSAGYVAIEVVRGVLEGREGTFALQHSGTMTRGSGRLTIDVVPDSGTGSLEGLSGAMTIRIEDGKHFYELEYTLS
jgi:Protein of unknown function (DUF3224)